MKTRLLLTLCLILMGIGITAAQENSDQFVGVWSPSDDFWVKKIKITYAEGNYTIQFKTDEGVKTFKDVKRNGNTLYCSFLLGQETGRFFFAYGHDGLKVKTADGSVICKLDKKKILNHSGSPHYYKEYMDFKLVLEDGNLDVYMGCSFHFYGFHNEFLFNSGYNYYNSRTFTNW